MSYSYPRKVIAVVTVTCLIVLSSVLVYFGGLMPVKAHAAVLARATSTARGADLTVTMSAMPAHAHKGDMITFTILTTNHGPDPAPNPSTHVYNPQPMGGLSNWYPTCAHFHLYEPSSCENGPLQVGQTWTDVVTGTLLADSGSVHLSVSVSDLNNTPDPNLTNNYATASVDVIPPSSSTLFSDGFESGDFSAWSTAQMGGNGLATVQTAVVKNGTYAARLSASATTNSFTYVRKTLSIAQTSLTVSGDVQIVAEGLAHSNVPIFRLYGATGALVLALYRQNQDYNQVWLQIGSRYYKTNALFPLGTWGHFTVHIVTAGTGVSTVHVYYNGTQVYGSTTASLARTGVQALQLGFETPRQAFTLYADNITAQTP